jgi:hypothetical protein
MKLNQSRAILTLLVAMNFAWTSACTSMQTVQMPGRTQVPAVAVGEDVAVTRFDGQELKFKVTAVEPDALVGAEVRVPYQDIAKLEVRRHDAGETNAVVAVVGGVLLALSFAALASVAPPPGP